MLYDLSLYGFVLLAILGSLALAYSHSVWIATYSRVLQLPSISARPSLTDSQRVLHSAYRNE